MVLYGMSLKTGVNTSSTNMTRMPAQRGMTVMHASASAPAAPT
jgi:hypothetical protein